MAAIKGNMLMYKKTKKVARGALSLTRGKNKKSGKGLFNCEEGKKQKQWQMAAIKKNYTCV